MIPSFGGYSADQGGTEIADSCKTVSQIAAAYESVITTYGVTRLDMDVEAKSLGNTAGIDRRNKAIKMTEDWAASNGIPMKVLVVGTGAVGAAVAAVAQAARTSSSG